VAPANKDAPQAHYSQVPVMAPGASPAGIDNNSFCNNIFRKLKVQPQLQNDNRGKKKNRLANW
jgi:hypothetical protein